MTDWDDLTEAEVAGWLRNVVIERTVAEYGNDNSRYEYAVLSRLATRIAPRTWHEMDTLIMSRLLADEARRRVPRNRKWAALHRSRLDRCGDWIDRLSWDAEKVSMTIGMEQCRKAAFKLIDEADELTARLDSGDLHQFDDLRPQG